MKLIFKSIKNEEIFESDFQNLSENQGTIEFKHMHAPGGLAVVYAPNGTGKSSFTKVVSSEKSTANLSFACYLWAMHFFANVKTDWKKICILLYARMSVA